ncbi:hypothetical protein CR513_41292, partial [Mucuna pruriens]
MERETPILEGSITRGWLRRIQEEVQHQLATLKDQEKGQEDHTVYYVSNCLEGNDRISLGQGPFLETNSYLAKPSPSLAHITLIQSQANLLAR